MPEANEVTQGLVTDLFKKVKGLIPTQEEFDSALGDPERFNIVTQCMAKYNIFMSQLQITTLMANQ